MPVKAKSRPINLGITDLMAFRWPIAALTSITHRLTGAILFVGVALLLFALDMSLSSESGFAALRGMMLSPLGKFVTWGLLAALSYHFVAGIKHLLMDMGVGETLAGGRFAAQATICISGILMALAAFWVL